MRILAIVLALLLFLAPLAVFAQDAGVTVGIDSEDVVFMGRWEKETTGLCTARLNAGSYCALPARV